jgi:hypothetical protein
LDVWVGDMNYRIDADKERIMSLITAKVCWCTLSLSAKYSRCCVHALQDWSSLVAMDQLTKERKAGRILADFTEGPLNFAPSYRFFKNSKDYDLYVQCQRTCIHFHQIRSLAKS